MGQSFLQPGPANQYGAGKFLQPVRVTGTDPTGLPVDQTFNSWGDAKAFMDQQSVQGANLAATDQTTGKPIPYSPPPPPAPAAPGTPTPGTAIPAPIPADTAVLGFALTLGAIGAVAVLIYFS